MKNTGIQPFLPAFILPLLCLILSSIIFYELPSNWLDQQFRSSAKFIKYQAYAMSSAFALFLYLSFYQRKSILCMVTACFATLFFCLVSAASWLNYDFYRDFLQIDALLMIEDIYRGEGSQGFSHLNSYYLSVSIMALGIAGSIILVLTACLSRPFQSNKTPLLICTLFLCLAALYLYKNDQFSQKHQEQLLPPIGVHPVSYFFGADKNHVLTDELIHAAMLIRKKIKNAEFPLEVMQEETSPIGEKKNVIIIVLESFRATEVGALNNEHKGNTPHFDNIAGQSLLFSRFFANSSQTVRSEISILCSAYDFSRGTPLSQRHLKVNFVCLPEVLKQHGYSTLWFHGNEKSFFARDRFFPFIGFDELHDEDHIKEKIPDIDLIGWGINDIGMMQYALQTLEQQKKPFFAEILTVSNHYPFNWGFPPSPMEDKQNQPLYNNFLRGIHHTDKALGVFWEKFNQSPLKNNTIVIITADHGLWLTKNNSDTRNMALMHFQQFHVPMLIWEQGIKPGNKDVLGSHVDITPTLLNLLKLSPSRHAFIGKDLLNKQDHDTRFAIMTGFNNIVSIDQNVFCFPSLNKSASEYDGYYNQLLRKENQNILMDCIDNTQQSTPPPLQQLALYRNLVKLNDYSLANGFISR